MASIDWSELSAALAFAGNTLLSPMNRTSSIGLDPRLWEEFPTFASDEVALAAAELASFARGEQAEETRVNVEFARLFVGPATPAAAPWETAYRGGAEGVCFGQATYEMRLALRKAGVKLDNANHQYEDHMGIELLLASVLCARVGEGGVAEQDERARAVRSFVAEHPLAWVAAFESAVRKAAPQGYYVRVIALAKALLAVM